MGIFFGVESPESPVVPLPCLWFLACEADPVDFQTRLLARATASEPYPLTVLSTKLFWILVSSQTQVMGLSSCKTTMMGSSVNTGKKRRKLWNAKQAQCWECDTGPWTLDKTLLKRTAAAEQRGLLR